MQEKEKVVVGISPGARHLGIAALEGDAVRFRTIVARRYGENIAALESRLEEALRDLRPDVVVLEVPGHRRLTYENVAVERAAARVLNLLSVPVIRERLTIARRSIVHEGPATRLRAHRALAERFPRLAPSTHARKGARWYSDLDRYWERAFAALTLAVHVQWTLRSEHSEDPSAGEDT